LRNNKNAKRDLKSLAQLYTLHVVHTIKLARSLQWQRVFPHNILTARLKEMKVGNQDEVSD